MVPKFIVIGIFFLVIGNLSILLTHFTSNGLILRIEMIAVLFLLIGNGMLLFSHVKNINS